MRFEDYLAANVLKPLGMNRSSFAQPLAADVAAATVPGKWWYQHAAPAGGLATTVEDITAFLSATMHEDSAVISKSSFAAMTRPQEAPSGLIHRLGYWTGKDHGQQLVGASGDSGSFHTVMATIPAQGIGVVVLVSGNGGTLAWGSLYSASGCSIWSCCAAGERTAAETESGRLRTWRTLRGFVSNGALSPPRTFQNFHPSGSDTGFG